MANRKAITAAIKRQVITEAGDRCAIPTCRAFPVELAHIIPHSETQNDSAENLIALCPNCHTRYDRGEITRDRIRVYKENTRKNILRFNGFEAAILEAFIRNPDRTLKISKNMAFLLERLIADGLLDQIDPPGSVQVFGADVTPLVIKLTDEGRDYAKTMATGDETIS